MKYQQRNSIIIILAFIMLFMFVASALAVNVNNIDDFNKELNKQETPVAQDQNLVWDFVKLIIVLGLIIGAAWSIIRLFGKQVNTRMQGNWLHLVDEIMMGQNRGIVLCEIAGKIYALGVTEHNINLLFEIDNPQLVREISETNLEELIQKNDPLKNLLDKLGSLKKNGQHSSVPVKNFELLMNEQTKKLHNLTKQGSTRGINDKRSGGDE